MTADIDIYRAAKLTQIMKQIGLQRELEEKYTANVARRNELTADQMQEIAVEGLKKGWPFDSQ